MNRIAFIAAAAVACAGIAGAAHAQGGKLGVYTGVVSVSGAEVAKNSRIDYRATIKVSLPVASRNDGSTRAEADDVDKPSAIATITLSGRGVSLPAGNPSKEVYGAQSSHTCHPNLRRMI